MNHYYIIKYKEKDETIYLRDIYEIKNLFWTTDISKAKIFYSPLKARIFKNKIFIANKTIMVCKFLKKDFKDLILIGDIIK